MCALCDTLDAERDARMKTDNGTALDVARARFAMYVADHFTGERRPDRTASDWATARTLLILARVNPAGHVTIEKSRAS